MSRTTSRRSFLRALGIVGAAMPFARLLERSALGNPSTQPLRFVGVFIGNGNPVEFWRPQPGFVISGLNQSLQPFDDPATYGSTFKKNLVVLDGINNLVANESNSQGHASQPCIWTGSVNGAAGSNAPKCESIETYLGVTKGLGSATAFPTVLYGQGNTTAFGAGGVPLGMLGDPSSLFSTLFASFQPNGQSAKQQADALARGKSTLDFVSGSLQGLQGRLAAPEKALLDQHLTAIRQMENRLMAPPAACSGTPTAPMCPKFSGCLPSNTSGDVINQMVIDIFVQAIACDLTRFMQFRMVDLGAPIGSSAQDPGVDPPLPIAYPGSGVVCADNPSNSQDCDHLDVAHAYRTSSPFALGGGPGSNGAADVTTQIRLARMNKYYMSYLASFVQQLAQYSLLDSTLVVTLSDVGNPANHDCINLPAIVLGGANGYFKMGQYLQLSQPTSQNALFVSIANAFGVDITSYGVSADASTMAGPIPGLSA
jgi:hypothetical protein